MKSTRAAVDDKGTANEHMYVPPPPVVLTHDDEVLDPVGIRCECGGGWHEFWTRGSAGTRCGDGVLRGGKRWRQFGREAPCVRFRVLTDELGGGFPYDPFPHRPAQLTNELERLQFEFPLLADRLAEELKAKPIVEPRVEGQLELGEIRATRAVASKVYRAVVLDWLTRHSNGDLGENGDVNEIEVASEHRRYPGFYSPHIEMAAAYQDGKVRELDQRKPVPHGLVTSRWRYVHDEHASPILISITTFVFGRSFDGAKIRKTFLWSPSHDHTKEQP